MLLRREVRDEFIAYANRQVDDHRRIAEQVDKLGMASPVISHHRSIAVAYALVANDLELVEEDEI